MSVQTQIKLLENVIKQNNSEQLQILQKYCQRTACTIEDLKPKDLAYFKSQRFENTSADYRWSHYEARRIARLNLIYEEIQKDLSKAQQGQSLLKNSQPIYKREPEIYPKIPLNVEQLFDYKIQKFKKKLLLEQNVKKNQAKLKDKFLMSQLSLQRKIKWNELKGKQFPQSEFIARQKIRREQVLQKVRDQEAIRQQKYLNYTFSHDQTRKKQVQSQRIKNTNIDQNQNQQIESKLNRIQEKLNKSAELAQQKQKEKLQRIVYKQHKKEIQDDNIVYKLKKLIKKQQTSSKIRNKRLAKSVEKLRNRHEKSQNILKWKNESYQNLLDEQSIKLQQKESRSKSIKYQRQEDLKNKIKLQQEKFKLKQNDQRENYQRMLKNSFRDKSIILNKI